VFESAISDFASISCIRSMLWLKERASVQPPLVYDSANGYQGASADANSNSPSDKSSVGEEEGGGSAEAPNSSGIFRSNKRPENMRSRQQENKRSRSSAGLGDTLRANTEATNKTLKENEEQRNVHHKENVALREKELELESKKVELAEKQANQTQTTGAGIISALDKLAAAVFELAKK
jgi:hypothetical protein